MSTEAESFRHVGLLRHIRFEGQARSTTWLGRLLTCVVRKVKTVAVRLDRNRVPVVLRKPDWGRQSATGELRADRRHFVGLSHLVQDGLIARVEHEHVSGFGSVCLVNVTETEGFRQHGGLRLGRLVGHVEGDEERLRILGQFGPGFFDLGIQHFAGAAPVGVEECGDTFGLHGTFSGGGDLAREE